MNGWWWHMYGMWFFWIALVVLVVLFVRWLPTEGRGHEALRESPIEITKAALCSRGKSRKRNTSGSWLTCAIEHSSSWDRSEAKHRGSDEQP